MKITRVWMALGIATLTTLWAQTPQCTWRAKDFDVTWTAYKTPFKIGVSGSFGTVKLRAKPAESETALLKNASVTIETDSVDSGNKGRDKKLVQAFFNVQGIKSIEAKTVDLNHEKGIITMAITMNGITRRVPMHLKKEENALIAEGVIDLGDFDMLPSLQALTKACEKPHQGKTWQDVNLQFKLWLKQKCGERESIAD